MLDIYLFSKNMVIDLQVILYLFHRNIIGSSTFFDRPISYSNLKKEIIGVRTGIDYLKK